MKAAEESKRLKKIKKKRKTLKEKLTHPRIQIKWFNARVWYCVTFFSVFSSNFCFSFQLSVASILLLSLFLIHWKPCHVELVFCTHYAANKSFFLSFDLLFFIWDYQRIFLKYGLYFHRCNNLCQKGENQWVFWFLPSPISHLGPPLVASFTGANLFEFHLGATIQKFSRSIGSAFLFSRVEVSWWAYELCIDH